MSSVLHPTASSTYLAPTPTQLADAFSLVERFAAVWAKPTIEGLEGLMHPDTRNLIPPMTSPTDRNGVLQHFTDVLRHLPDTRVEVIRWAPTGDTVIIEWRAHATVAGKPMTWTGIDRFGIRGERMYEARVYWDTRQVAAQMAAAVQSAQGTATQA
jgi:ketosteroid isomerase-like protein